MSVSEAYSKPWRISKMELIAKKVKIFQPLTVFAKISILDVRQGSEYTSEHYFWLFFEYKDLSRNSEIGTAFVQITSNIWGVV